MRAKHAISSAAAELAQPTLTAAMKFLIVLSLAALACAAPVEKKTEKRGILSGGLGYGYGGVSTLGLGSSYGLGHGISTLGLGSSYGLGHGISTLGLGSSYGLGHGIGLSSYGLGGGYGLGIGSYGLGHGVGLAAAPISVAHAALPAISHGPVLTSAIAAPALSVGHAPLALSSHSIW